MRRSVSVEKVEDAVKKNGGTFKGDKTKGSFNAGVKSRG
jgi:hypothetical protein